MSLPLCHGMVQESSKTSAAGRTGAVEMFTVPAARLPGASGAVAARLLVTVVSASESASLALELASLIGFVPGFV